MPLHNEVGSTIARCSHVRRARLRTPRLYIDATRGIEVAPMFTAFLGARPVANSLLRYGAGDVWCIIEAQQYDAAVIDEARSRGIPDPHGFQVQRDDAEAPAEYSDLDGAVDALVAGYSLAKLPDAIGTGWAMYVLDPLRRDGRGRRPLRSTGTLLRELGAFRTEI